MNRNEKGQISPAQSRIARQMRRARMGEPGAAATRPGLMSLEKFNAMKQQEQKRAKSRVVLRGQKDAYRKSYTKVGTRMHKKGLLKAPDEGQL